MKSTGYCLTSHGITINRMQSGRPLNKKDFISVSQNILFILPWLTKESQWPTWNISDVLHLQVDKEPVTDTCLIAQSNTTIPGIHNVIPVSKYSTLQRLLRVSTYILQFIHNVRDIPVTTREVLCLLKR